MATTNLNGTLEMNGTLARRAIQDYLWTGNPSDLEDAYYRTRYAARAAIAQESTTHGSSLIGRFGLNADPRGAHAIFTLVGRDYLVEVLRAFRDDVRGCWLLETRHLNGETAPPVALSFVHLLNRH